MGGTAYLLAAQTHAMNVLVHDVVARRRGCISAEHGIGQLRREELGLYKSPAELAVMRAIKKVLNQRSAMRG